MHSVPVGKYAKAALEKLGVWASVENEDARWPKTCARRWRWWRAARPLLGIVYETDAKVEPNVKIVGAFPADSHPAIVYPVAR